MLPLQLALKALIFSREYRPVIPHCPDLHNFLFEAKDPEFFNGLETLGDMRLASNVSRIQADNFSDVPLSDLRMIRSTLLSNWSFQYLVAKLEVDTGGLEAFSKEAGNGFEVFVEALGQLQGDQVAADWLEDLFRPLIEGLVRCRPAKRTRPQQATKSLAKKERKRRRLGWWHLLQL
ncbi:hypothetical protein B0H13DRAFT_1857241 [Mycena leptocephala]|nr:hypothetical protein B0H13DRAFT_1857241 [Mycena leptocephala]